MNNKSMSVHPIRSPKELSAARKKSVDKSDLVRHSGDARGGNLNNLSPLVRLDAKNSRVSKLQSNLSN